MSWDILSHWKDAINDGLLQIVPDIETCVLKISETSLPSDYDSELKSFLVPQVTSFVTSTRPAFRSLHLPASYKYDN